MFVLMRFRSFVDLMLAAVTDSDVCPEFNLQAQSLIWVKWHCLPAMGHSLQQTEHLPYDRSISIVRI